MSGLGGIGRTLLLFGVILAAVGLLLIASERFPGLKIGRLPGDISVERGNFKFYFPLATSIAVSVVLTLLFWIFGRR